MRKMTTLLAVLCGLSMALAASEEAQAIGIGFAPSSITASAGDSFFLDVVVTDLAGGIVSAYDLDVIYDATLLSATSVSFGPLLGDVGTFQVLEDFDLSTPGVVDLAQLSLLSDGALASLQPDDGFVIASLGFSVGTTGSSTIGFSFDAFNDVKGVRASVLDVVAGTATVRPPGAPIPEPTAAAVFGAGILVVSWRHRRDRRSS